MERLKYIYLEPLPRGIGGGIQVPKNLQAVLPFPAPPQKRPGGLARRLIALLPTGPSVYTVFDLVRNCLRRKSMCTGNVHF